MARQLFSYEFRNVMGTTHPVVAPRAFKSANGANASGLAFRKQMGRSTIEIRVVRLVPEGTGRVVKPYEAEIGEWH